VKGRLSLDAMKATMIDTERNAMNSVRIVAGVGASGSMRFSLQLIDIEISVSLA
jgi:hypothetical protein